MPHLSQLQCPACRGPLTHRANAVRCANCGSQYTTVDGAIIDFVGGRFDTQLDPHQYDADHGINDDRSAADYRLIRRLAGDRWPETLGSMVEIGCGTGAFSRAVLAKGAARDAVLTDVSVDMLRICRAHLQRVGVAGRVPLSFATYSSNEPCFADDSFDSCIGIQVLHHIMDYEAFLADLFRFLKPGGIAFFAEPALRFHLALATAVAELVAAEMARDPAPSHDRQVLHNWIGEQRRGCLHQGALEYLARLEDKHMFEPDAFAALARRIGFTRVEAFPLAPDPHGGRMARGLLGELGVSAEGADAVQRMLPRYSRPHFGKLAESDRTPSYLFWLTKPQRRSSAARRDPPARRPAKPRTPKPVDVRPAHWFLELRGQRIETGLAVTVEGWCLVNSDVQWLRIRIGATTRDAAVWYPRADVHGVFNQDSTYTAWNSLCCGVTERLVFEGVPADAAELPMTMQLVLTNGACIDMPVDRFRPDQPLFLKL